MSTSRRLSIMPWFSLYAINNRTLGMKLNGYEDFNKEVNNSHMNILFLGVTKYLPFR